MKKISYFLSALCVLCGSINGFAVGETVSDPAFAAPTVESLDDDRLLFEFFSKEIAKMDVETIQRHPEIVFRKSLIGFHLLADEESPQRIHYQLSSLKRDLEFVMYYVKPSSPIFKAAKLQIEHIDFLLSGYPRNAEDLIILQHQFFETWLKEWATDKTLTGKDLRENVFLNLQGSPRLAHSFFEFATVFTFEAEPILGAVGPIEAHLVGLVPQGKDKALLVCEFTYQSVHNGIVKTTTWKRGF